VNHQTIYTTQSSAQQQSGSQIITVSQQQSQLISNQGQQQSNMQTVVPLTLGSRAANIKTITVSTSNAGTIEHRNLSNQSTTIVPIQTKLITQQSHQNITSSQRKNFPTNFLFLV
jgi:hypothetical protein